MGKCFSCLRSLPEAGGSRGGSVNMGSEGKFVSPETLEASIFSERGVPPSVKPAMNGGLNGGPARGPTDPSNFTLNADVGTYDRLAQEAKGVRLEDENEEEGGVKQPKREPQTLMRRCFPPVGLSLVLNRPIDEMVPPTSSRNAFLEQIREDVAYSVHSAKDRIRVASVEKGGVVAQLNILADLGHGDNRSPMQIACDLVEQARDDTSFLRTAKSTSCVVDAKIHESAFPTTLTPTASGKATPGRKSGGGKRAAKHAADGETAAATPRAHGSDEAGAGTAAAAAAAHHSDVGNRSQSSREPPRCFSFCLSVCLSVRPS